MRPQGSNHLRHTPTPDRHRQLYRLADPHRPLLVAARQRFDSASCRRHRPGSADPSSPSGRRRRPPVPKCGPCRAAPARPVHDAPSFDPPAAAGIAGSALALVSLRTVPRSAAGYGSELPLKTLSLINWGARYRWPLSCPRRPRRGGGRTRAGSTAAVVPRRVRGHRADPADTFWLRRSPLGGDSRSASPSAALTTCIRRGPHPLLRRAQSLAPPDGGWERFGRRLDPVAIGAFLRAFGNNAPEGEKERTGQSRADQEGGISSSSIA